MWQEFIQQLPAFFERHPMLSIAWVGCLGAAVVLTIKAKLSKVKGISRSEAISFINKDDAIIVDLRANNEFRSGHIAHSINVLPAEIKKGSFGSLEKQKNKMIIVVCETGMTAQTVAHDLSKQGFERVSTLKEGISGWNGENLPLVRGK